MGGHEWQDNRRNKKPSSPGIDKRSDGESSLTWAEYWTDIKKLAFGWMGLDPHKFYKMDNEDFFLMKRGFEEMLVDRKRDLRRLALIIVSPQVEDMPSAMRIWPIQKDDELEAEIKRQKEITQEEHNKNWKALTSMFKKAN